MRQRDARRMITAGQWARQLGVHRDTVRRWCIAGMVPGAEHIGIQWLVPEGLARPTACLSEDDGLSLAEAARRAGLTRERLRQVVNRGDIQTIRDRGRRYVARRAFDEWLRNRAAQPSA